MSRNNPEDQWVINEVPELQIIDDALWSEVKARQQAAALGPQSESSETQGFWSKRRPRHLLSGLLACGVCGGGFVQVGRDYLGCAAHRNKGTCDHSAVVKRERLEAAILDGRKDRLVTKDLVAEFCAEFVRETNRIRQEQRNALGSQRRELAGVERGIRNMIEAVKEGLFVPSMKPELLELERRRETLVAAIDAATQDAPPPTLHPALAETYREKVANLHVTLENPVTRAEAMDIIRGLIERIVVAPDPETDGSIGRLEGDLASLLSFASPEERPGRRPRAFDKAGCGGRI